VSVFGQHRTGCTVKHWWGVSWVWRGSGSQITGTYWQAGIYRAGLFSEGGYIASGSFEIYKEEAEVALEEEIPQLERSQTGTLLQGEEPVSGRRDRFEVENGLSMDAVVIVVLAQAPGEVTRAVYIRAGDSFTLIDLRGGTVVYFMTGMDWDAHNKRFLTNPRHKRFERGFDFSRYEYRVTLYPVVGGTAKTEPLDEEDFPSLS